MVSITMRLTVDQITKEVDNVTKGCKRQLPDIHHLALPQDTRSTVEVQQKATHLVPGTFQIRTRLSQPTQFVSLFSSTQWNLGRVPAEGSRPFSNQSCRRHGNMLHRRLSSCSTSRGRNALTVSSNKKLDFRCMYVYASTPVGDS